MVSEFWSFDLLKFLKGGERNDLTPLRFQVLGGEVVFADLGVQTGGVQTAGTSTAGVGLLVCCAFLLLLRRSKVWVCRCEVS